LDNLFPLTKTLLLFAGRFISYYLASKIRPLLAGYKITHRCNLKCLHCPYWKRSGAEANFDGVVVTMQRLRNMGVKILMLEGGEPMLWRDGRKTIKDVVDKARELFPCVCMTTNGTIPWEHLGLDRVWVSLDGPRSVHDSIRGDGVFDRVLNNLGCEAHRGTFVSSTINRVNMRSIPELMSCLSDLVAGVTIQFHYPYGGLPDPLYVERGERAAVLDELMSMKRSGVPVANSFRSLEDLKQERWTCENRLLANAEPDGSINHGCYLQNRGNADCSLCGFAAHNEMSLAFRSQWESISTGARIFFGCPRKQPLP
jgi:Fe-coproporphyrin III synthase